MKEINIYFSGSPQEIDLQPGRYLFQLWGAKGRFVDGFNISDKCKYSGGNGAYVAGIISFSSPTSLLAYVGQYGNGNPVFNSLKDSDGSINGGGASDIRLVGGDWFNFESLKSRIIVAAGGGGGERVCGGDGGGLVGGSNNVTYNNVVPGGPGNQTSGGFYGYHTTRGKGENGTFGLGGKPNCIDRTHETCDSGAGGGGGYYGGGGTSYAGPGGGGSSFVSGHDGCDAISNDSSDFEHIIHTSQSKHYSGYSFEMSTLESGQSILDSPSSSILLWTGNNGYIRISQIDSKSCHLTEIQIIHIFLISYVFSFIS